MPYINGKLRSHLEPELESLIKKMKSLNDDEAKDGICNYVISRIVANTFRPVEDWNYKSIARAVSCLECAKLELYRRIGSPHEDDAIKKNGDLVEYTRKHII